MMMKVTNIYKHEIVDTRAKKWWFDRKYDDTNDDDESDKHL